MPMQTPTPTAKSASQNMLSQRDPAWINHFIGRSKITVGADGCALTCLSMTTAEFNGFLDPAQIASKLSLFTPTAEMINALIPQQIPCISNALREFSYIPLLITRYLVPGKFATHLQVPINVQKGEYHWLKVKQIVNLKHGVDYLCNNPWTGMPCFALATYGRITGSLHLINKT